MLIGNYSVLNKNPGRAFGGSTVSDTRAQFNKSGPARCAYFGGIFKFSAVPNGYTPPYSWSIPMTGGGMAVYNAIYGTAQFSNVNLAGGINIESSLSGSGNISDAQITAIGFIASLILSGSDANIDAAALQAASAIITSAGSLSAPLGALYGIIAELSGSSDFTSSATGLLDASSTINADGYITSNITGILNAIAVLSGAGVMDSTIMGIVDALATISGSGNVVSSITALANLVATITSGGSVSESDLRALAYISATISPFTELSPENLATSVWNAVATEFNNSGTMGERVNDAGAGGDPWATDIEDGGYTGNQAGKKLRDSLTKNQFIALK